MAHPLSSALRLFHRSQDYLQKLVADLSDEQMLFQPEGKLNPPSWILGHLAIVNDYTLSTIGQPTVCDKRWHVIYGPNTEAISDAMRSITKEQLLERFQAGHDAITKTILDTPASILEAPHTIDFLRPWLVSNEDLLTHLLTTHVCVHLGQLSAWRRVQSLPSV